MALFDKEKAFKVLENNANKPKFYDKDVKVVGLECAKYVLEHTTRDATDGLFPFYAPKHDLLRYCEIAKGAYSETLDDALKNALESGGCIVSELAGGDTIEREAPTVQVPPIIKKWFDECVKMKDLYYRPPYDVDGLLGWLKESVEHQDIIAKAWLKEITLEETPTWIVKYKDVNGEERLFCEFIEGESIGKPFTIRSVQSFKGYNPRYSVQRDLAFKFYDLEEAEKIATLIDGKVEEL